MSGHVALGRYSTLHEVELIDATIVADSEMVAITDSRLVYCDLTGLPAGAVVARCMLVDCMLPAPAVVLDECLIQGGTRPSRRRRWIGPWRIRRQTDLYPPGFTWSRTSINDDGTMTWHAVGVVTVS